MLEMLYPGCRLELDGLKLIRTTIQVIIYVFVLVYAEIRFFIVTCVLYFYQSNHNNVLRKLAIRNLNNSVVQEFLSVDLAKTQNTRDDEEPYFCKR